ncbi:hypothetical protein EG68_07971 [Paragonimus skrjabini miyazakii]|uniref:Uncharacterized protein n=1 Tax=Paragonimus skrjabini miyazakii TaxID=59628 RepID=A0A8S9YXB6_9TREM|nr:hypothetical protein EG68_07971 [Paragonimus skrjabini miyazakii]
MMKSNVFVGIVAAVMIIVFVDITCVRSLTHNIHWNKKENRGEAMQSVLTHSMSKVPFYKLISYFVTQTLQHDPKVHDVGVTTLAYYTHIYHAWLDVEPQFTVVATDSTGNELVGANMVLELTKLARMYAPGNITRVLDFVIPCYNSVKPKVHSNVPGYISTLQAFASENVYRSLIKLTTEQFLKLAPQKSYHLLWANSTTSDQFLKNLNYKRIVCGDDSAGLCNWTRFDKAMVWARNLCVYRIIKA